MTEPNEPRSLAAVSRCYKPVEDAELEAWRAEAYAHFENNQSTMEFWPDDLLRLIAALREARADLERCRCQLAGCGVAAFGYSGREIKQGDYGYSASYGDVLDLRDRWEKSEAKLAEIRAVVKQGLKYDWSNTEAGLIRHEEYVERLEEVIGE